MPARGGISLDLSRTDSVLEVRPDDFRIDVEPGVLGAAVDEDDEDQVEAGAEVYAAAVEKAIDLGGTATGEHGIGLGKRKFLAAEHGAESVEAMRRLERAFDPRATLNPGEIFPETADGGRVRLDASGADAPSGATDDADAR